jgi:hypothetical protein
MRCLPVVLAIVWSVQTLPVFAAGDLGFDCFSQKPSRFFTVGYSCRPHHPLPYKWQNPSKAA